MDVQIRKKPDEVVKEKPSQAKKWWRKQKHHEE